MTIAEIVGGFLFGSIAVVADGLHMSTHAGALLLAALAYSYARKHANDPRFTFGTGKFGDLAGFTSAIILGLIAVLIGYEAVSRIFAPVPIHFTEAIAIAGLGLVVNFASVFLLGGGEHDNHDDGHPHTDHHHHHRDHNMRAAVVHVMADAAVSVCVIVGLSLAWAFDWMWMDPVAGIIGAFVIVSWSYGLIRDTAAILLDMNPDTNMAEHLRETVEREGDAISDLHLWRLGPGHLGAILSVATKADHNAEFYREKLAEFAGLSHLTVEVRRPRP
jgi:cation diffusion facilitator family transporter